MKFKLDSQRHFKPQRKEAADIVVETLTAGLQLTYPINHVTIWRNDGMGPARRPELVEFWA
jgi:hypothetical protein